MIKNDLRTVYRWVQRHGHGLVDVAQDFAGGHEVVVLPRLEQLKADDLIGFFDLGLLVALGRGKDRRNGLGQFGDLGGLEIALAAEGQRRAFLLIKEAVLSAKALMLSTRSLAPRLGSI